MGQEGLGVGRLGRTQHVLAGNPAVMLEALQELVGGHLFFHDSSGEKGANRPALLALSIGWAAATTRADTFRIHPGL
ncbi:hypothetical protein GCM10022625_23510 [Deinococcus aetherius]